MAGSSPLPQHGLPAGEVAARLRDLQADDVRWRDGRAFTLAYSAGPEVLAVAEEAYRRFMTENALNTDAFPSLRMIQQDVVAIVAGWLSGGPEAAGFMTTGGTESILLAVEAARQRGLVERDIRRPNVVLPTSAHAAFEKGAHYFGLENRRIPVRDDWRADVDAMAAAIDDETVLVVGSAPQYPQGVIDPVTEIAALADERSINCHVDACMGGVTLPYLARLGYDIPPFDFSVPGVTSISVDLHKFGYTGKGASVIVHRTRALRRHQVFVTENWLGGTYGSSGLLGTKSGGPMAAAWAVLHHLGDDGYLRLAAAARTATEELAGGIRDHPAAGPPGRARRHAAGLRRRRPRTPRCLRACGRAVAEGLVRGPAGPAPFAPLHRQRDPRRADPGVPGRSRRRGGRGRHDRDPRRAGRLRHRGVMPYQGRRAPDR